MTNVNKAKETLIFQSTTPPKPEDFQSFQTVISADWFDQRASSPPSFLFWLDEDHFHFLARRDGSAGTPHPESQPGYFQAELWRYDVAEFFLRSANGSRYLEFNLSPNGGWWSCLFGDPLQPESGQPSPVPGVRTRALQTPESWQAQASVPRRWIEERFPLDESPALNATFILDSPHQTFFTAGDLGGGEPNFHQPALFPMAKLVRPA